MCLGIFRKTSHASQPDEEAGPDTKKKERNSWLARGHAADDDNNDDNDNDDYERMSAPLAPRPAAMPAGPKQSTVGLPPGLSMAERYRQHGGIVYENETRGSEQDDSAGRESEEVARRRASIKLVARSTEALRVAGEGKSAEGWAV